MHNYDKAVRISMEICKVYNYHDHSSIIMTYSQNYRFRITFQGHDFKNYWAS